MNESLTRVEKWEGLEELEKGVELEAEEVEM